jgi:hypothetical protein
MIMFYRLGNVDDVEMIIVIPVQYPRLVSTTPFLPIKNKAPWTYKMLYSLRSVWTKRHRLNIHLIATSNSA